MSKESEGLGVNNKTLNRLLNRFEEMACNYAHDPSLKNERMATRAKERLVKAINMIIDFNEVKV